MGKRPNAGYQEFSADELRVVAELVWQRIRANADYESGVSSEKPLEPSGVAQKVADDLYQRMGIAAAKFSIQDLFLYAARTQNIMTSSET